MTDQQDRIETILINQRRLLVALADFVIAECPNPKKQSTHRTDLDRAIKDCAPWREPVQPEQSDE